MTRPRFSLRALLLATAAVAAFCYWRDLPRQNANRFAALIEAEDYVAAEAMMTRAGGTARAIHTKWRVTPGDRSFADWLLGRYPMTSHATFGFDFDFTAPLEATASGVEYQGLWESSDPGSRTPRKLLAPL